MYHVDNIDGEPEVYNLDLENPATFKDQKINFSLDTDANKLVVATYLTTGHTILSVFDRRESALRSGIPNEIMEGLDSGLRNGVQIGLQWQKCTKLPEGYVVVSPI